MSKLIETVIEHCHQCPAFKDGKCIAFKSKPVEFSIGIPGWCPMPDRDTKTKNPDFISIMNLYHLLKFHLTDPETGKYIDISVNTIDDKTISLKCNGEDLFFVRDSDGDMVLMLRQMIREIVSKTVVKLYEEKIKATKP